MSDAVNGPIISADSHVMEDSHLWSERLPSRLKDDAPVFPSREERVGFQITQAGGWDPKVRVEEMAVDGVAEEVLYPSWAMNLFSVPNAPLQEACLRAYNDWLIEYCSVAPDRLFGIATLCTYDIAHAVSELERCKEAGLVGAMIWEVPPADLPFSSNHYDELWKAAQSLEMPISLHSFTGVPYTWPRPPGTRTLLLMAQVVNRFVFEAANATAELIMSGVFERFPELRFVLVENEVSWIPCVLERYDHHANNASLQNMEFSLSMTPSETFERNIFATFFNERVLGGVLNVWGTNNCMWSNDFPHLNSTWPNSLDVIERDLGHLPLADRQRLTAGNVRSLYHLPTVELPTN